MFKRSVLSLMFVLAFVCSMNALAAAKPFSEVASLKGEQLVAYLKSLELEELKLLIQSCINGAENNAATLSLRSRVFNAVAEVMNSLPADAAKAMAEAIKSVDDDITVSQGADGKYTIIYSPFDDINHRKNNPYIPRSSQRFSALSGGADNN